MRVSFLLLPLCLLGLRGTALAQVPAEAPTSQVPAEAPTSQVPAEAPTSQVPAEAPTSQVSDKHQSGKHSSGKKGKRLSWSGRVFVGDTLTRREVGGNLFWRNEQAVNSARVALRYDHSKALRAVIKVEFGEGKADLKDGYIRLKLPASLKLQAGRFKKPISSIALTSRWDLPSVERGLLDSVSVEGQTLPFAGGRGEGVMLDYRAPLVDKVGVAVALMQNKLGVGDVSLDAKEDFAQDLFARVYAEPVKGLHLASTFAVLGYLAKGTRDSFRHAPVGTLEVNYEGRWIRAWAEAMAGKSPFARVDGSTKGNFWAARSLVAPRLRAGIPRRVEPFLGASALDPRTTASNDANYELMGGINLAFAKDLRLQIEVAQVFAEGLSSSATESTAFRIQLGARLKD